MGMSIVLAVAAAVLVLAVAAVALGLANPRRERQAAALGRLRAMRWQELAQLVADALAARGLQRDDVDRHPGEEGFDLRMSRGSSRYLVQCKHGAAFHVEAESARELQRLVDLQGAAGGILVTTGVVTPQARNYAGAQPALELIDGLDLWEQVQPLLPEGLRREVEAEAAEQRRRKWILALAMAIAGALAGAVVGALLPDPSPGQAAPVVPAPPSASVPPPAAPIASPAPGAQDEAGAEAMPMPDPTLSEQQLAGRRAEAQRLVQTIPDIAHARWTTRSTMVVDLRGQPDDDTLEAIVESACVELLRYEELRFTRLQLQPAADGDQQQAKVRWRQCR